MAKHFTTFRDTREIIEDMSRAERDACDRVLSGDYDLAAEAIVRVIESASVIELSGLRAIRTLNKAKAVKAGAASPVEERIADNEMVLTFGMPISGGCHA